MTDIKTAVNFFQAGDLQGAETICLQIIGQNPHNSKAFGLLGLILRQKGDIYGASDALRTAIKSDPNNLQALFNYGVVLLEINEIPAAIGAFRKAIHLLPHFPEAYFNLGNALFKQDSVSEAITCYRQAVILKPDHIDAHYNLGLALKRNQEFNQAALAFEHVISFQPEHADALFNLGLILHFKEDLETAKTFYQKAINADSNQNPARYNLGIVFSDQKNYTAAVAIFKELVELQPDYPEAFNNLGLALFSCEKLDEAEVYLQKAIELRADFYDAYSNLGNIFLEWEELSKAKEYYKKAVSFKHDFHKAWYNLAKCYSLENNLPESLKTYRKAIEIKYDLVEAHWNLSHVLLANGEFSEGFKEYLWRWQRKEAIFIKFTQPEWQGETIPYGTLLVHTEQGLGDAIQFVRYLKMVKPRVKKLILACEKTLIGLFATVAGIDELIDKTAIPQIADKVDYHVPILNLPTIFETTLASTPDQVPYVTEDQSMVEKHKHHFQNFQDIFKVGIVWQGNPLHKNDHNRSCRLDDFLPLLSIPQTVFFNLQKNNDDKTHVKNLKNLGPFLDTFADTAAIISHLDLIISVDTSVAHLAGAMAKPVWALIPFVPEWRWMLDREDTPWYPTMRLFRQQKRKDWQEVFIRVYAELKQFL